MDKEAEEKIRDMFAVGQFLDKNRKASIGSLILSLLEQLGYHKLPEGEPPLLSDEEVEAISFSRILGRYKEVAQAQRESDIEWMRNENLL